MTKLGTTITIKTKGQIEFEFKKLSTEEIYYLISITDRNNNQILLTYQTVPSNSAMRRLYKVREPVGREFTFNYGNTSYPEKITSITDPQRTIHFSYYPDGRLKHYTDPINQQSEYIYSGKVSDEHLLEQIKLPKGNIIDAEYEDKKVISIKTNQHEITSNWQWDGIAQEGTNNITIKDLQNNTTFNYSLTQNSYGLTTSATTPTATIAAQYSDADNHKLITQFDQNGDIANYEYYSNGNIKKVTLPMSVEHQFTYTALNDIQTYTDPENNVTSFNYSNGNLASITYPESNTISINRQTNGLINSITNPENITVNYSYDSYGNVTNTTLPLGIVSSATYDVLSRIISATNPNNKTTQFDYLDNDYIEKITNSLSNTMLFGYDANDNVTSITNEKGVATTMTYDYDMDYLLSQSFGGQSESFTYYEDGRLKSYTDKNNYTRTYTYFPDGKIKTDGYAEYVYDSKNRITEVKKQSNLNHKVTYTYDALNRVKTVTDYYNNVVEYFYDKNSNVTKIRYPGNKDVTYDYDGNNRLTKVTDWLNNTTDYTYRDDGLIARLDLPNGSYSEYQYDAAGRLEKIFNKKSNGTIINSYDFNLDPMGNHINVTQTEPYGIPTLPNVNITGNYDNDNSLNNLGSIVQTNDNANRALSKTGYTYTWDNDDYLLGVSGNFSATYEYDGSGHRRKATRNGVVTKYVLDVLGMEKVLIETDQNDNAQYYYIHGMGLLYRIKASNNTLQHYHYDYRGSTIAITDDNENITHQYSYGAYGAVLQSSEVDFNPYRYVGRFGVMYEDSTLYFMRARYYDVETRRFLSEDPIWSSNLMAYSNNNPINRFDPSGEIAPLVAIGLVRTAIGAISNGKKAYYSIINGEYWDGAKYVGLAMLEFIPISKVAKLTKATDKIYKTIGKPVDLFFDKKTELNPFLKEELADEVVTQGVEEVLFIDLFDDSNQLSNSAGVLAGSVASVNTSPQELLNPKPLFKEKFSRNISNPNGEGIIVTLTSFE